MSSINRICLFLIYSSFSKITYSDFFFKENIQDYFLEKNFLIKKKIIN